jgi:hypothetical protein
MTEHTQCSKPPPVDDIDLAAYVEGEAGRLLTEHLADCEYCASRATQALHESVTLHTALQRATCPAAEALGALDLGLLEPHESASLRDHLSWCTHCCAELDDLRAFLGSLAAEVKRPLTQQVRTVVARLVGGGQGWLGASVPLPAHVQLRGLPGAAVFEADSLQITLDAQRQDDGSYTLTGLVTGAGRGELAALEVELVRDANSVATSRVDEIGNFELLDLGPGLYRLVLRAVDREIWIEGIDLASG